MFSGPTLLWLSNPLVLLDSFFTLATPACGSSGSLALSAHAYILARQLFKSWPWGPGPTWRPCFMMQYNICDYASWQHPLSVQPLAFGSKATQRAGGSRKAPSTWGTHVTTCAYLSLSDTWPLSSIVLGPTASPSTLLPNLSLRGRRQVAHVWSYRFCFSVKVWNSRLVNSWRYSKVNMHPRLQRLRVFWPCSIGSL